MERLVTTQEARVQTVQVEIQVLKVGKKQVTMGMFRQLPLRPLVHRKTAELCGEPWGHVNYWWEGDGRGSDDEGQKRHVVWQHEHTLYRDIAWEEPPWGRLHSFQVGLDTIETNLYLLLLQQSADVSQYAHAYSLCIRRPVSIAGHALHVTLEDHEVHTLNVYCHRRDALPTHTTTVSDARQASDAYQALLHQRDLAEVTPEVLQERHRAVQQQRDAYQARWKHQWECLKSLPQLFIAV